MWKRSGCIMHVYPSDPVRVQRMHIDAYSSRVGGTAISLHAHPEKRTTTRNQNVPHDARNPLLLSSSLRWRRRQRFSLPLLGLGRSENGLMLSLLPVPALFQETAQVYFLNSSLLSCITISSRTQRYDRLVRGKRLSAK